MRLSVCKATVTGALFVTIIALLPGAYGSPSASKDSQDGPYIQESEIRQMLSEISYRTPPEPVISVPEFSSDMGAFLHLRSALEHETHNIPLMLHYLTKAEKSKDSEKLSFWISLYRAKAYFQSGDYKDAGNILEKLLSDTSLSEVRTHELRELRLQSLLKSGDQSKYLFFFKKYIRRSRQSVALEPHYWHASQIASLQKQPQLMIRYLEHLVLSYPIGEWSRKAFRKLYELSCPDPENPDKKPYVFSRKTLTKLARNAGVDPSLESLLIAFSKQKMKMKNGSVRTPDDFEQIEFLTDARVYHHAYQQGMDLYRSLPDRLSRSEHKKKKELMILLGRLANRLYKHQDAVRHFSNSKKNFQDISDKLKVSEYLADSLSYGGFREDASGIYGYIAKKTNKKLLRWHHFWSRYASDDMEEAGSLIASGRKKSYVPPRDYLQPHGPRYWKARILENLNKKEEAQKEYQYILKHHSDDIYANFITIRHPHLSSGPEDSHAQKNNSSHEISRTAWIAARLLLKGGSQAKEIIKSYPVKNDLLTLVKLYFAGLHQDVRKDIQALNAGKRSLFELALISHLGKETGAWHTRFQFAKSFILKELSGANNWYQVTRHQLDHSELWKAYYPFAYEGLLEKVTKLLGIDPYFMLSIMRMESYYKESALSWVGARGLMQIMPYTAVHIARRLDHQEFKLNSLWNSGLNIIYGAWYLRILMEIYQNNPILTAAAYNAGPFAVNSWIERCNSCEFDEFIESIPYKETRRYVKNILRSYTRYNRIYLKNQDLNFAFDLPGKLPPEEGMF